MLPTHFSDLKETQPAKESQELEIKNKHLEEIKNSKPPNYFVLDSKSVIENSKQQQF